MAMAWVQNKNVSEVIRSSDLRKATKQLSFNRGEFKETDCADLLVSSFAATFRSVGTEAEVPIAGTHPGTVRLPLKILVNVIKVAKTYNTPELKWHFEPGVIRVEKFSLRNPDITLGIIPDLKFDLPADVGSLHTLAVARLRSPEQIADQVCESASKPPRDTFAKLYRLQHSLCGSLESLDGNFRNWSISAFGTQLKR